ncbi:MAG: hypothetical protein IPJ45_07355 [Ignavibacteria bacterium]|nr:hypothetical protein [Ignavibacteria bacterium]
MSSFETAFKIVKELSGTFKENERKYLSSAYQEAEVRKDFIDKFFIALGWDVNHDFQRNPYEQEVKVEKGMNIGKAQKRTDVNQMLSSKKQLSISQTENEKSYWEQKCNSIDNQIDRLVYELYGLTEEEIGGSGRKK